MATETGSKDKYFHAKLQAASTKLKEEQKTRLSGRRGISKADEVKVMLHEL